MSDESERFSFLDESERIRLNSGIEKYSSSYVPPEFVLEDNFGIEQRDDDSVRGTFVNDPPKIALLKRLAFGINEPINPNSVLEHLLRIRAGESRQDARYAVVPLREESVIKSNENSEIEGLYEIQDSLLREAKKRRHYVKAAYLSNAVV